MDEPALDERCEFVPVNGVDGAQASDRTAPVGHDDLDACLHLVEIATQVVLEIADTDLDSTRCGHVHVQQSSHIQRLRKPEEALPMIEDKSVETVDGRLDELPVEWV